MVVPVDVVNVKLTRILGLKAAALAIPLLVLPVIPHNAEIAHSKAFVMTSVTLSSIPTFHA